VYVDLEAEPVGGECRHLLEEDQTLEEPQEGLDHLLEELRLQEEHLFLEELQEEWDRRFEERLFLEECQLLEERLLPVEDRYE
jgi:hypothetical protein